MKVLVADDEEGILVVLESLISYKFPDCVIRTFPDGLSVIEAISACDDPDCWLITDFNMPGAKGVEVIKAAKRSGFNPQRIILMTGHGIPGAKATENVNQALKLGIRAAVIKPDISEHILQILQESVAVAAI